MASSPERIVELDHVSKVYPMGEVQVTALSDASLSVAAGEFVVILGPSGCGKSTMMNIIGGLDSPTSGVVKVAGEDITLYTEVELTNYRRNRVGFIFQFFNLVTTLTVRENVQLVAEMSRHPRDVDEVIEAVGLADRASHFPSELSGGQQQRTAIARALVKNAPLLLCDEPTGELDSETGRLVLALLHQITHDHGQTVMMVTHNATISRIADRILRLRNGRIVADETNPDPISPDQLEW
ncbi:MAG: ATP-binding cassette domain-containing protein [Armatimonadetes bacterium]|nr:ATP-binding cassette domain-containing protein [Armatimonadota bacterium]